VSTPSRLNKKVNIGLLVNLIIGALFLLIGNYLPKAKQNYTGGHQAAMDAEQ
jgi:hypothetical protein